MSTERELQRQNERLDLLLNLTSRITSSLDLRDVLRSIAANIREVILADAVAVGLPDAASGKLPFMPGRRTADKERAFFAIFSTMIGAIEIARLLPDPAMRQKMLESVRDFLLQSF